MNDEDVSINGDGSNGQQREPHIDISQEREEHAQCLPMHPLVVDEPRCRERQVDAAEDEVCHTEANDESSSCTANAWTAD